MSLILEPITVRQLNRSVEKIHLVGATQAQLDAIKELCDAWDRGDEPGFKAAHARLNQGGSIRISVKDGEAPVIYGGSASKQDVAERGTPPFNVMDVAVASLSERLERSRADADATPASDGPASGGQSAATQGR